MRPPSLASRSLLPTFLLVAATIAACSGDEFVPVSAGAGSGGTAGAAGTSVAGGSAGNASAGGSGGTASAGAAGTISGGNAGSAAGGSAGATSGGNAGASAAGNGGDAGTAAGTCANDQTCEAIAGPCRKGTCMGGQCTFANDDTRLPPQAANDCRKATCKDGQPESVLDLGDPPDVDEPCAEGVCNADGSTGTKPRNEGGLCEDNRVCNKGFCVACSGQSDCPTYGATDCRISTGCANGKCGVARNPNGVPDEQPGDCIAKKCLDDGAIGESFEPVGKVCTNGAGVLGQCDAKGECMSTVPGK